MHQNKMVDGMDNNNIKKEALATRNNPFAGKSLKGFFSSIGKGGLKRKSESYKEAVRIMEEIDSNLREAFKKQQGFAKEAYWGKFKMDLSRFAQAVNNFFNQEVIMITLITSEPTKTMQKLMMKVPYEVYKTSKFFGKLEKAPELPEVYVDESFDVNEFTEILNDFNEEGGLYWADYADQLSNKTEEKGAQKAIQNVVEEAKEEESTQEKQKEKATQQASEIPGTEIENPTTAELEIYDELVKSGFLGSWHYKSLSRGKALKKSMERIFDLMQITLDQSAHALAMVTPFVRKGDPDEYIKELSKLVKKANSSMVRIVPMWNEHFANLIEKTDEGEIQTQETKQPQASQSQPVETAPEQGTEMQPEQQPTETISEEQTPQEYMSGQELPTEQELLSKPEFEAGKELTPEPEDKFNEYISRLRENKLAQNYINEKILTGDYKGLSKYIKNIANNIEDKELQLKLIAIAEEADE